MSLTDHSLHIAKSKIDQFLLRDQFVEDYTNSNILDNYIVYNSLKGTGRPPSWDYYMNNLDGHMKTISQKGKFFDSRSVR